MSGILVEVFRPSLIRGSKGERIVHHHVIHENGRSASRIVLPEGPAVRPFASSHWNDGMTAMDTFKFLNRKEAA